MSKVMLCLDGSSFAEQAIPYALGQLRRPTDELILIRVVEPVAVDLDPQFMVRLEKAATEETQSYLEDLATRLRARGAQVSALVVEGSPAVEIGDATREHDIDLVVIGSHGRTGMKRWLLGSVAENVGRYSSCPVWLVRCATIPEAGVRPSLEASVPEPGTVLLPLDGTPAAERAVDFARDWLRARPARLILVAATDLEALGDSPQARREHKLKLATYLSEQVARLNDLGWHAEAAVEDSMASEAILDVAERTVTMAAGRLVA